jgi:NTE family protein
LDAGEQEVAVGQRTDAVFEGGGVKGIGLVGAVSVIEESGYVFENLAGTSAGAIVASLLAVGYSAAELKRELERLDYRDFEDQGVLDKLGLLGKGLSLGFEYGVYEGEFFESWLEQLLAARGKTTFGEVRTAYDEERYRYRLQVIAADVSDRRLLVLPGDLRDFGYDPDRFSIARAVRMSMSIPFFFEPVKLQDSSGRPHLIVDGGLLSNYPVWLLDDGTSDPPWPTFGFKLIEPDQRGLKTPSRTPITSPVGFLKAVIGTMLDAHDRFHISRSRGDYDRTIGIPTVVELEGVRREVRATDFGIGRQESQALFENGVRAARTFLAGWDFEQWKEDYRRGGSES